MTSDIRLSICCSEWKKRDKAQRVQRERAEKKVGYTLGSPIKFDLNVSLADLECRCAVRSEEAIRLTLAFALMFCRRSKLLKQRPRALHRRKLY